MKNSLPFIVWLTTAMLFSCAEKKAEKKTSEKEESTVLRSDPSTDLFEQQLFGPVKSVTDFYYEAIQTGDEYHGGRLFAKSLSTYNKNGKILETGFFTNDSLQDKTKYERDSSGHLLREVYYDKNGKMEFFLEFIYDATDKIIKSIERTLGEGDSYNLYHYDKAGNLIRYELYSMENEKLEYDLIERDRFGNAKRVSNYDGKGVLLNDHYDYFDANGNNMIKSVHWFENSWGDTTYYKRLKVDPYGNWTQLLEYTDKRLIRFRERTIQYH